MKGLMQDHPLLISSIFEHAINNYPTQEIVSNSVAVSYTHLRAHET